MKIQFIKNAAGIGFGYFAGAKADLKNDVAKELIKDGYAITEADAKAKEEAEAEAEDEDSKE